MATPDQVRKAKALLGITGSEKDLLVEFSLESAEDIIKNYCHIDRVPEGLNTTMYRMAADIYRNEQFGQQDPVSVVTSISEGDTTTSFGGMASEFTKSMLKDYGMALRQYRRVAFR